VSAWESILHGGVHLSIRGKGFINIFIWRLRILEILLLGEPWFFKNSVLGFHYFTPLTLAALKILVWIRMLYLPNEFKAPGLFTKTEFLFGSVLQLDPVTLNR